MQEPWVNMARIYIEQYKTIVVEDALSAAFDQLQDAPLSTDDFSFYTSVASVCSSKIEGETIELDSYIKHKRFHIEFQPDYTRKIDDLYQAYQFASENRPGKESIAEMHKLLASYVLQQHKSLRIGMSYTGLFKGFAVFIDVACLG